MKTKIQIQITKKLHLVFAAQNEKEQLFYFTSSAAVWHYLGYFVVTQCR